MKNELNFSVFFIIFELYYFYIILMYSRAVQICIQERMLNLFANLCIKMNDSPYDFF